MHLHNMCPVICVVTHLVLMKLTNVEVFLEYHGIVLVTILFPCSYLIGDAISTSLVVLLETIFTPLVSVFFYGVPAAHHEDYIFNSWNT